MVDCLRVGAAVVVPLALSFAGAADESPFVVALDDALVVLIVDGFFKALVVEGLAGSAVAVVVVGFDGLAFAVAPNFPELRIWKPAKEDQR